jgi:hypothetical protein
MVLSFHALPLLSALGSVRMHLHPARMELSADLEEQQKGNQKRKQCLCFAQRVRDHEPDQVLWL